MRLFKLIVIPILAFIVAIGLGFLCDKFLHEDISALYTFMSDIVCGLIGAYIWFEVYDD